MAAPKNPNPPGLKSEKEWRDAIRLAVHGVREAKDEKGKATKKKALRLLAEKLVDAGLNGEITALKEIGDRLDGKPVQGIEANIRTETVETLPTHELMRIAAGQEETKH